MEPSIVMSFYEPYSYSTRRFLPMKRFYISYLCLKIQMLITVQLREPQTFNNNDLMKFMKATYAVFISLVQSCSRRVWYCINHSRFYIILSVFRDTCFDLTRLLFRKELRCVFATLLLRYLQVHSTTVLVPKICQLADFEAYRYGGCVSGWDK